MKADEFLPREVLDGVFDALLSDAGVLESTVGHVIGAEAANGVDVDAASVNLVGRTRLREQPTLEEKRREEGDDRLPCERNDDE